jgi:hypothetical protein
VLQSRECAPTPSPFAIFTIGLIVESIKELGGSSNDIFREWFDGFVAVYIDDILVCNNLMEEHVEHFRKVFER